MSAEVQPMLQPDEAVMRQHLEHLFGGFLDGCQHGRVELAWTDPNPDETGRFKLRHAETFDVEEMDALVAKALRVNSQPRTNVYIGAALRRPETCPVGRCEDSDFYATTVYWADLDDKDANDQASRRFAETAPSLVVRTGEHPHWRHQLWWRLSEPVFDPERARAAVQGITAVFGGDSVANPSRVMRLAGTIAWDQKPGRRPELTKIIELKTPGLRAYYPDHVERAYPPLVSLDHVRAIRHAPGPNAGVVREASVFGLPTGKVVDGREKHMTDVICARMVDYCGQFGSAPTPDELFEHAWDAYERSTALDRPGRNKPEFLQKCRSTMRRFELGKIRGARNLDEAVASYKLRREAKRENVRHEAANGVEEEDRPADGIFEFLDVMQIKAMEDPKWLIDGLAVENALGFIFGAPGSGKTFVALSQALSLAVGLPDWWGRAVQQTGPVIYVSSEGQADLKFRIAAWEDQSQTQADTAPFYLIRESISFMKEEDVWRLLRTLEAIATKVGNPVAVYVDTVSRVLPGADENLQKDMTLFIAACDAVRQKFKATVIGVHHTSRNGNLRGSTVFDGAGDFLLEVSREKGKPGKLIAQKIKAARDGWEEGFELKEINLPFGKESLVAIPAQIEAPTQGAGWPDKNVCNQILYAIQEGWDRGGQDVWSTAPQADTRYAPNIMNIRWGLPRKQAQHMIRTWIVNKMLMVDDKDKKAGLKGLKVIGPIS